MSEVILIKNGRVIDPASHRDEELDVLLRDGKVAKLAPSIEEEADQVIDAAGWYVVPGLIDMHARLRDPGELMKETLVTGTKAAAKGGYTSVVVMPNTRPVIDNTDRVEYIMNKAKDGSPIHVIQTGAVTLGQKGLELTDMQGMYEKGVRAFGDDGRSVMNAALAKAGMQEAARLGLPYLAHCEDADLAGNGCVNEDEISRKEGLPGISNAVEDTMIARDLILAHEAGVHLHLAHCSTRGSYDLVKAAKERGWNVSAEVCPHHFTLTSADRKPYDTNFKMNPPLRTEADRQALLAGLRENVFDVISTDHAPHTADDKSLPMEKAAFGVVGLETSLSIAMTELVHKGVLNMYQLIEKMSANPARIMHLEDRGSLAEGKLADVTLIDPNGEYVINSNRFVSRGKNTPFHGRKVKGRVMYTICEGKVVYKARIHH